MVLLTIFLLSLYLIIGRVIVKGLNKWGYISNAALYIFDFVLYVFLPITLLIICIRVASDYLIKLFKL
jgi:hypothetical protein